MKRTSIVLVLIILLTITIIGGLSCGEKQAKLPVFEIGDKWVYKMEAKDLEYDVTLEVIEEDITGGKDCYVYRWSFKPKLMDLLVDSYTVKIDKTTLFVVEMQLTGTMLGLSYSLVEDHSSELPEEPWWPLKVGKEIRRIETINTVIIGLGEKETEEEIKVSTYEVVSMEEITVTAGTFRCFKIYEYDEGGKIVSTEWYSDDVKRYVKQIDYENGKTMELKSYSL